MPHLLRRRENARRIESHAVNSIVMTESNDASSIDDELIIALTPKFIK
jgi:hypothetical protein